MKKLFNWKHLYEGFCLGIVLLAPGLSVATVAMILGIYEQLLNLVSDLFSPQWKATLKVLIPLGIGALIALAISSRLIVAVMESYPMQTDFLFLGLVMGAIPMLLRTADAKNKFKSKHVVLLVCVALLVAALDWLVPREATLGDLDVMMVVKLVTTGVLISAAMLLPGLSAALVLVLLGTYQMLSQGLSTFNIPIIASVGIGAILGLIVASKGIKFLLNNYLNSTNAACIGMVIGSIVVIYPGLSLNPLELVSSLLMFTLGLVGVIILNKKKASYSEMGDEDCEESFERTI